jgi:hypothetical protein
VKKLSPQSQSYLRAFKGWLRWYPAEFQTRFGGEMLQLLEDQLRDAEKADDPYAIRETYAHAVIELPLSIARERLSVPLSSHGISQWRAFSYAYLLFAGVAALGFIFPDTLFGIPVSSGFFAAGALIFASWKFTGRFATSFFLVVLGFLAGLGTTALVASWGLDSNGFAYGLLGQFLVYWAPIIAAFFVPYLVLFWLKTHPGRFGRKVLANLSPEELEAWTAANARKRRIAIRTAWAILAIVAIPNAYGYFNDPYGGDVSSLGLVVKDVPRDQNSYYVLESVELPGSVVGPNGSLVNSKYVSGADWNEATVSAQLAETARQRARFAEAAALPAYEIPDRDQLLNSPDMWLTPLHDPEPTHTLSDLVLLDGRRALRAGDAAYAVDRALEVVSVSKAVSDSDVFFSEQSLPLREEAKAFELIADAAKAGIDDRQKAAVIAALPTVSRLNEDANRAMRWEAAVQLSGLPKRGFDGASYYGYALFFPYAYQPNRTAGMLISKVAADAAAPLTCPADTAGQYGAESSWVSVYLTYNGLGKEFSTYWYGKPSINQCAVLAQAKTVDELLRN